MSTLTSESVADAYNAFAFAYDSFTADYCYDRWLAELEGIAIEHGLRGRRLLDVACGTGKSFLPLLERGYEVTGCDISPAMVARAASKAPAAQVFVGDMRGLPDLGEFDFVTCLDDALNHLLDEDGLVDALEGIRRHLAPGGVAIWDVNTLSMYRRDFSSPWVAERDGLFMTWRCSADAHFGAGAVMEATIDVFAPARAVWERSTSVHYERHWPPDRLVALATSAGLLVRQVLGQRRGAVISPGLDESVHTKAVFVATRHEHAL